MGLFLVNLVSGIMKIPGGCEYETENDAFLGSHVKWTLNWL